MAHLKVKLLNDQSNAFSRSISFRKAASARRSNGSADGGAGVGATDGTADVEEYVPPLSNADLDLDATVLDASVTSL